VCTLDAEPGAVELRARGKPVKRLVVTGTAMAVTIEAPLPPPQPPEVGNGY
jgi:hypothetical protein